MRYIKVVMDTFYVGTREEEYLVAEDDVTDDEIDQWVEGMAEDHADMYRYLATQGIYEEDYAEEEDYEEALAQAEEDFNQDIYYGWEEISEENAREMESWVEWQKIEV